MPELLLCAQTCHNDSTGCKKHCIDCARCITVRNIRGDVLKQRVGACVHSHTVKHALAHESLNSTQDAKEVHLDDNLRRANLSAPLMVTPSSQRQLELALWSDTAFLSGLAIMDYSLLVSAGTAKSEHLSK